MPFSYAQYTGNGSTTTFSVPFPYLLKAHVKVYLGYSLLDGTFTSELANGVGFNWTSATQIQTVAAPASGQTLTVIRQTPSTTRLVDWQDGSNLISDDLDTADLQNLYVVQEQQDRNNAAITQFGASAAAAEAAAAAAQAAAEGAAGQIENVFTGNGSQATFTLSQAPPTRESLLVTVDGLVQPVSKYSLSGTALTLSEAPASGAKIRVLMLGVAGQVQSASTLSFSQAGPGAVTRTVQSKLREVFSVLDFIPAAEHEAITGKTSTYDCAPNINAMLSALPNGSAVYFPPGKYVILSSISNQAKKFDFIGAGSSSTVIQNNGTSHAFNIQVSYYVTIKGLQISGSVSSLCGIYISAPHCRVIDCFIGNNGTHGIYVAPGQWCIDIFHVTCFQNGGDGIFLDGGGEGLNVVNIDSCILWLNNGNGVRLAGTSIRITNCTIETNVLAGVRLHSLISTSCITISDNHFEHNKHGAIHFLVNSLIAYVEISANYLYDVTGGGGATDLLGTSAGIIRATLDPGGIGDISCITVSGTNRFETNLRRTHFANLISHGGEFGKSLIQAWSIADTVSPDGLHVDPGFASIDTRLAKIALPGKIYSAGDQGWGSGINSRSVELISTGTTPISYDFNLPLPHLAIFRKAIIKIITNSISYTVNFGLYRYDSTPLVTGSIELVGSSQTHGPFNQTQVIQSSVFPSNAAAAATYRLNYGNNHHYFLRVTVTNTGGGSTLQFDSPVIEYYT